MNVKKSWRSYVRHSLAKFVEQMHEVSPHENTVDVPLPVELDGFLQVIPKKVVEAARSVLEEESEGPAIEESSTLNSPQWFTERVTPVKLNPQKIKDKQDNSLLHIAAKQMHFSAVVVLLQAGLSWESKNRFDKTVYVYAGMSKDSDFVKAANAAAHLKNSKIQRFVKKFLSEYKPKHEAINKWLNAPDNWIKYFYQKLGSYLQDHYDSRKGKIDNLDSNLQQAEESLNDQALLIYLKSILDNKQEIFTGKTGKSEFLSYLQEILEDVEELIQHKKQPLFDNHSGSEHVLLIRERSFYNNTSIPIKPDSILEVHHRADGTSHIDASVLSNVLTHALDESRPASMASTRSKYSLQLIPVPVPPAQPATGVH